MSVRLRRTESRSEERAAIGVIVLPVVILVRPPIRIVGPIVTARRG
jgi:hypothetical protein